MLSHHLRKAEPFDAVVKKYSNGPGTDRSSCRSCANPASVTNRATADALRHLAEGQTSAIIETAHSFRVVTRTPAGSKPFEDVLDSIKQAIGRQRRQRALPDVLSQATIESPYIDDVTSILPPPPCPMPKPRKDDAFAEWLGAEFLPYRFLGLLLPDARPLSCPFSERVSLGAAISHTTRKPIAGPTVSSETEKR